MQAINEEAKQGGAEGATLPQPHGGGLAVPSGSVDPHGEQAPIIQGLYGAQHGALYPQSAKQVPQQHKSQTERLCNQVAATSTAVDWPVDR